MDFQTGHFADSVQFKIGSHLADFWSSQNLSPFFIFTDFRQVKVIFTEFGLELMPRKKIQISSV